MTVTQHPAQHETKYTLPNRSAAAVVSWLQGRCLPDPDHPAGLVSSVYYDSPDLHFLREKINSDFFKTKLRLRWYRDGDDDTIGGPAFLELKRKVGGRRFKHRVAAPIRATTLLETDMQSSMWVDLLALLRDEGVWLPTNLRPFLEICFQRLRFLEPMTRTRVSIDTNICTRRVNPAMLPLVNPFPLAHAVLEIKGSVRELPGTLSPLRAYGCHKESFSKYGRCYQNSARRSSF